MKTLFLSVGDASGDEHCSLLVREIKRRHPDWKIVALAGPRCQAAGAEIFDSTEGMGVIGFSSALMLVPRLLKMKKRALQWARQHRPDVAILCDWGGFNTRILPNLKQLNVPVLYYFPPRSWQREGEGGTQIVPFCKAVATPFEWSAQRLERAGANVKWVGHPILERVAALPPREELRSRYGMSDENISVVMLPGSRLMEWKTLGPHLWGTVQLLLDTEGKRNWRFFIAAPRGTTQRIQQFFPQHVSIIEGQTLELMRAADIGVIKSGTSTLEAAALNLPQVVAYELTPLLNLQVKVTQMEKKIRFAAMPNIMLDRLAVPEYLRDKCRAPLIARELLDMIDSPERLRKMRTDYDAVRQALGSQLPEGATYVTVDMIEQMMS